jgi:excisionase family DNA binding protein
MERDFITTTEAAQRLGITRQTLSAYLRQGKLRGVKLGKEWRIPRSEFERLLAAPEVEGGGPQQ